ncbi:hypothetical protein [Alteromonas lipolytica]|uniref:Uncharacterized protein n=1 Tax=Alteromonas lipolytica TaxID=1856405 RepID=A0A1E8FH53_9ALTE|nr:hypothetical protein [Alteromonas lipolytica]OFI35272.1 hypothetical protein BFC17_17215 [Alteromonas lipolytica]GGF58151.1 hypothetical protein GCM10011338_08050 [Alteromonas lipolytica]
MKFHLRPIVTIFMCVIFAGKLNAEEIVSTSTSPTITSIGNATTDQLASRSASKAERVVFELHQEKRVGFQCKDSYGMILYELMAYLSGTPTPDVSCANLTAQR